MLHDQIRQARIDHGLNQSELARRAGIPRDRLRQFENGENITVETLMKILAQLPNLQTVNIGAVEVRTGAVDIAEVREAVAQWLESGRKLLTLLERIVATPDYPGPGGGGATRHKGGTPVNQELEQRLAKLEAQINATKSGE